MGSNLWHRCCSCVVALNSTVGFFWEIQCGRQSKDVEGPAAINVARRDRADEVLQHDYIVKLRSVVTWFLIMPSGST